MSRLMVKDVMERTGIVSPSTIYRWIDNGYLKGIRVGNGRGQHWEFEEHDFEAFLKSGNYSGNPDALKGQQEMFSRVPLLENCYPYNLLKEVFEWEDDRPTDPNDGDFESDIWTINIPAFRDRIWQLTDREQRALELRYQFGLTLDEIAAVFGVTRERIRQIQLKAIRKLRYYSAGRNFRMIPVSQYKELEEKNRHLETEIATLKQQLDKTGLHEEEHPEEAPNTLEVPVYELDLSVRSYNCLVRAGITTVSAVLRFDATQNQDRPESWGYRYATWTGIRNLGIRSLKEIAEAVYRYCGYRIRTYDEKTGAWTVVSVPGKDDQT